ncbi:peptide MFS transporter [Nannocystaceae bacterium ST9]
MSESSPSSRKHPQGLYRLFFIEMWERLAFYTMVNVLLLYATDFERGGLGLSSGEGNEIYGLYLAFVYFTPFPGGMLADRFLGYRRAVLIGGLIMASGLFLLSIPGKNFFYLGILGLVLGNGLFKPNISVMVGNLYEAGDPKRDSGFNIFYMGINIGAFIASFLASSVRNQYGWLWTFRVASVGLLIGLVILLISWKVLEKADRRPEKSADDTSFGEVFGKILLPALVFGIIGFYVATTYFPGIPVRPAVFGFLVGMAPVIFFFVRLGMTAKPSERPGLLALLPIYVAGGTFFMVLHLNGSAMTQWANETTRRDIPAPSSFQQDALPSYYANAAEELARPNPQNLVAVEDPNVARMFGQKRMDEASLESILAAHPELEAREFATDVTVTSLEGADKQVWLFSTAIYADGKVTIDETVDSHGSPVTKVNVPEGTIALRRVALLREGPKGSFPTYVVSREAFDKMYAGYETQYGHAPTLTEPGLWVPVINPELFQSLNALYVVGFTPLIVAFFAWLTARRQVTTARKVFWGLCLTTASLLLMVVAGVFADGGASKVSGLWLVGFYAIITIGELLLSPMGLSLVTKLAPKRLVGLAMGGWFLATAFGNNFSGFFGGIQHMLDPVTFFLILAGLAAMAAVFIRLLLPRLDAAIGGKG